MKQLCTDPKAIISIDAEDCIGLSLATINTNFQVLLENVCSTYDNIEGTVSPALTSFLTSMQSISSYLPRIAKVKVNFNGTTPSLSSGYNVGGITRLGLGHYQVFFNPPFTNTNYAVVGTCSETIAGSEYVWLQPVTFANNSVTIKTHGVNNTLIDPENISMAVYNN